MRFKQRIKSRIELTELEAKWVLFGLDHARGVLRDEGESVGANAIGRVMSRLGAEMNRVGAGKIGRA